MTKMTIEELESMAQVLDEELWLSYSDILASGVPFKQLHVRGWVDGVDRAGMYNPLREAVTPEPRGRPR